VVGVLFLGAGSILCFVTSVAVVSAIRYATMHER
jgi:hypothetical protein